MHSSRMHTTCSSSLSACWDTPQVWAWKSLPTRPLNLPLGVGLDAPQPDPSTSPLGVSLETPQPDPSTPPWVWAWRSPQPDPSTSLWVWVWRLDLQPDYSTPPGCGPGDPPSQTPQPPSGCGPGDSTSSQTLQPPPWVWAWRLNLQPDPSTSPLGVGLETHPMNRVTDMCKYIILPQLHCGRQQLEKQTYLREHSLSDLLLLCLPKLH